jgi:hypothetical protein
MPVHDWTHVDPDTFHAFHTLWIGELMKALHAGRPPHGYYAMAGKVATALHSDLRAHNVTYRLCDALREYADLVKLDTSRITTVKDVVLQVFDGVENMQRVVEPLDS